jgi:TrpR family transcriptional regulator, trp operon repressor
MGQVPLESLSKVLLSIKDTQEMREFVQGFFTPSEIEQLWERWRIIELLLDGQSQRSVKAELGVSIATVSRGANVLRSDSRIFKKIKKKLV